MKTNIKFIVLIVSAGFVSCFFVGQAQANIIISQVQITGGSGHTADDFIELFNPTANPFNLNGHRLVKRSASSTSDTSIKSWTADVYVPAYGFFLWANDGFSSISAVPDEVNGGTVADDNGIALRQGSSNTGTIIDSVAWGGAGSPFANVSAINPGAGESLTRGDLWAATSAFSVAASNPRNSLAAPLTPPGGLPPVTDPPVSTTTATSTLPALIPTATTTYATSVKISEIVPNPSGTDDGSEAVELVNTDTVEVDISGWFLDDKTTSGIKSGAYELPRSTVISAGGFLVITIPTGHFSLNNSGGDEVNLYYPDKTLADTITYSENAAEGEGYQNVNGGWVWGPATLGTVNAAPPPKTSGGGGSGTSYGYSSATYIAAPVTTVQISEFMPNPQGADEGLEWVELYNYGSATATLTGWKLDDAGTSSGPGSKAYTLDSSFIIPPKSFLVVTIPAGKFVLNNSESDAVRLFKPDSGLIETVNYSDAPEGKSYGKDSAGKWSYSVPTPGAASAADIPLATLIISELLPNPDGDEEFVEVYNFSSSTAINLKGFKLVIGSREKVFDAAVLATSSYLTLYEDDLPVNLRNTGQTVKILDSLGREITSVTYEKAGKGMAYAFSGAGFVWTEKSTPGIANELVLGAVTDGPAPAEKIPVQATAAPAKKTAAIAASVSRAEQQLERQVAELQERLALLEQSAAAAVSGPVQPVATQDQVQPPSSRDWAGSLALVLAAAALLIVIAKHFLAKS